VTDEDRPQWVEHFLLLYFSEPGARERIGTLFPAHNAYGQRFRTERPDELVMIGPFPVPEEGQPGAMAIFRSAASAEEFAASDPFVVEGAVSEWRIRPWLVSPS
jgi:uncharacterized protein YciI